MARVRGLDVARAAAVVGMVMVHVGPTAAERLGAVGRLYDVTHGRASILFVVLAGVGVALLTGDGERGRVAGVRRRLAWRAALLLPLGLALERLDHGVLVILQYYAAYVVVVALVLRRSDGALLRLAAAVAVLGPVVRLTLLRTVPEWFAVDPTAWGDAPTVIVRNLLVAGSYPVVTWSAPLLLGLWLGRRDLADRSVRTAMIAGGAAVAVLAAATSFVLTTILGTPIDPASWAALASGRGHSEMPLWLVGASGAAVAVIGLCLVVADRWPGWAWPLAAVGQLALTVYVGHLLVLVWWPEWLASEGVAGATLSVMRLLVVSAAAAVGWRSVFPRGPLEALLRLPAALHEATRRRGALRDAPADLGG